MNDQSKHKDTNIDVEAEIATILAPAIDARAPYAKVMIGKIADLVLRASSASEGAPADVPKVDKHKAGLYRKFDVRRTDGSDGPNGKHYQCCYYVLDLTHDEFALPAIRAYANACRDKFPNLARDLDAIVEGNPLMPYRTHLPPGPKSLASPAVSPAPRSVQAGFVRCRVCGETKRIETGIVCAECDASATKEGHSDAE